MDGLLKAAILKSTVLLASCTAFLMPSANADTVEINPPYPALGLIKTVTLEVKDAVTGDCWTNVKDVEANTRLKLEQSGIAVED